MMTLLFTETYSYYNSCTLYKKNDLNDAKKIKKKKKNLMCF